VGPRRICDIYDFFAPHINVLTYLLYLLTDGLVIGNESAPIHLAQCRFPGLAIPDAKILILFFQTKYTEAILSNSTRKLLWFEITKMPIAV